MDLTAVARILGEFSEEMTRLLDTAFGTDWATNHEILALVTLGTRATPTTREVAAVSGLPRRALSRLVARLVSDGLLALGRSATDRRAVTLELTPQGRRRVVDLELALDRYFHRSRDRAAEAVALLGGDAPLRRGSAPQSALAMVGQMASLGVGLERALGNDASAWSRLSGRQRAALYQITYGSRVRPGDLSPGLGLSPAGATYVVDQLCAKGLATRERGSVAGDRRGVVLHPTEAGRRAASAAFRAIDAEQERLVTMFSTIAHWDEQALRMGVEEAQARDDAARGTR